MEKLSREPIRVGWPWRFFIFSILVLIIAVVAYVGLQFGYAGYLNRQIAAVDEKINILSQSIPVDQQQSLSAFYSQLANLQRLLASHTVTANLFPLLQKNTNTAVAYQTLELRVAERRLVLEGTAASYQILAQQLEAFQQMAQVDQVTVNESRAAEGHVAFRISITFKKDSFQ